MMCPHCGCDFLGSISVLCWVYVDNGELAEAAGDLETPDAAEPPQLAYCGQCGQTFGPREGCVFRVVQGRPCEVEISARPGCGKTSGEYPTIRCAEPGP